MSPVIWVAFIIGIVCGAVAVIVVACCRLAGDIDRELEETERRVMLEKEQRELRERMEQSTCDGNYKAVSKEKSF